MSINKHALIRYQALDRCFANRGRQYYWEDLQNACNKALYEYSGRTKEISRRQLFEDIKYMESDQGWAIPLDRHKEGKRIWYRYLDPDFSINKRLLKDEEAEQLREALQTLERFKGLPQFEWMEEVAARLETEFGLKRNSAQVIEFERNPYLKGYGHLTPLFHAILNKQVLVVEYQGFRQDAPSTLRFHPYYLKQYNSRWFAFGWNEKHMFLTNLALDRIQQLEATRGEYHPNEEVDFTEHFENVVGVSVPDGEPEEVRIWVSMELWPYIETKPLHGSQRVVERMENGKVIQLSIQLNYEFESLLLSYGAGMYVMEPPRLRQILSAKIDQMQRFYQPGN